MVSSVLWSSSVLFTGFGSSVGLATVATLTTSPVALDGICTATSTVATAPAASGPVSVHTRCVGPVQVQVPWTSVTLPVKVSPAGRSSVIRTGLAASDGPTFCTRNR